MEPKSIGHSTDFATKRSLNKEDKGRKATVVNHNYTDFSTIDISELRALAKADDTASDDREPGDDGASPAKRRRSKESSRVKFPVKLHQILSNPEYHHIIRWMPHGRSWNIYDKDLLASVVCKKHFHHDNFDSFNRSVNGWGFKRLFGAGPDCKSYYHELFLRGRPDLAQEMKRLVHPGRRLPNPMSEPNFYEIAKRYPLPPSQNGNKEEKAFDKGEGQDLSYCLSLEESASTGVPWQVQGQVTPVKTGPPQVQLSCLPRTLSVHKHHHHNFLKSSRHGVAYNNVPYLNAVQLPQRISQAPFARDYGHHNYIYKERDAAPGHYRPPSSSQYDFPYPHHAHEASQHQHYPPRQHEMATGYGEMVCQREAYNLRPNSEITLTFDHNFEPSLQFSSNNFASHCAVASVASSYEESSEYLDHNDAHETEAAKEASLEKVGQSDGETYLNEVDAFVPPVLTTQYTYENHHESWFAPPTSFGENRDHSVRSNSPAVNKWNQFFDQAQHTANTLEMEEHAFTQNNTFNEYQEEYDHLFDHLNSKNHNDHR